MVFASFRDHSSRCSSFVGHYFTKFYLFLTSQYEQYNTRSKYTVLAMFVVLWNQSMLWISLKITSVYAGTGTYCFSAGVAALENIHQKNKKKVSYK